MTIPNGICVDLETTISSKIPDHVRPPGKKRFETRILEIGAVDWQNPTVKYQALVYPIQTHTAISSTAELFQTLTGMYQHPTRTINFWSKVLVKRHSLTRHMFSVEEEPEVWLARQVNQRAKDFVRWHNEPASGPMFVSEKVALEGLLKFTEKHSIHCWLAHNGNSFDFKVLEGCSERHCVPLIKNLKTIDTLKLFRKHIPGHKSYSQPVLYETLFNKRYNAHVAIDDAIALATLCRHVVRSHASDEAEKSQVRPLRMAAAESSLVDSKGQGRSRARGPIRGNKKTMDLTFQVPLGKPRNSEQRRPFRVGRSRIIKSTLRSVQNLKGIGPKTAGALAAVNIHNVKQLVEKYRSCGDDWLKNVLPYGARFKIIKESLVNP